MMFSPDPCRAIATTWRCALVAGAVVCGLIVGCGTTQSRTATEQLVTSDAVDRSIALIDFAPLSGQKVFLDVEYLRNVKGVGTVNAEYVISSLRQQILSAGCLLQENKHIADYIIEARVGALGIDAHDVVYGVPANNALNAASSLVPAAPAALPTIPELALAKRNDQTGASKVGAFAYDRVSREVVWQAGISQSRSTSRDSWIAGVGPFQSGNIYKKTRFAGSRVLPLPMSPTPEPAAIQGYRQAQLFKTRKDESKPVAFRSLFEAEAARPASTTAPSPVQQASATPATTWGGIVPAVAEIPAEAQSAIPPTPAASPRSAPALLPVGGTPRPLEPTSSGHNRPPAPTLRGSRAATLRELEQEFGRSDSPNTGG